MYDQKRTLGTKLNCVARKSRYALHLNSFSEQKVPTEKKNKCFSCLLSLRQRYEMQVIFTLNGSWARGTFLGISFHTHHVIQFFVFLPYSETFFSALPSLASSKKVCQFHSSALGSGKFSLSSFVRCNFFGQYTVVIKVLLYCRVADKWPSGV